MGMLWIALAIWTPSDAPPLLQFDPPQIHLGAVKAGQMFERKVRVTNQSRSPLRIREIKSSCGCLAPKVQPEVLQPDQSAELLLRINSLSAHPGPQAWRVTLWAESNGVAQPQEMLLSAEVEQELVISPASVTLYGNRRATEHVFRLTDRRPRKLRLLKVDATSPLIRAKVSDSSEEANGGFQVHATVEPGFPEGRHDEQIVLYTDDAEYAQLRIPVTIIRKPARNP